MRQSLGESARKSLEFHLRATTITTLETSGGLGLGNEPEHDQTNKMTYEPRSAT